MGICLIQSLSLLRLEVPGWYVLPVHVLPVHTSRVGVCTFSGMKIHEHTGVFQATLASTRCSSDLHPGNSLLKISSKT